MSGELAGVLETVLYHSPAEREDTLRFYEETLSLRRVSSWPGGVAYRLGAGVLLAFDREQLAQNDSPVSAHGTAGPGHVCFTAAEGAYGALRERLAAAGVEIEHDHEWPGGRSFYFRDPAGNLLEVADTDIWPR